MCINFTDPKGNKCEWGFYCTHAHGDNDMRNQPLTDIQNNSKNEKNSKRNINSRQQRSIVCPSISIILIFILHS